MWLLTYVVVVIHSFVDTQSARNLNTQARLIKDMMKRARERLRDKKEEEGLVEQANLVLGTRGVPRLQVGRATSWIVH